MKKRAADLTNSIVRYQVQNDVSSKLTKDNKGQLTLNQQVQGSSPWRLTTKFTSPSFLR